MELHWNTIEEMKGASKEELLEVFGNGSKNLINLSKLLNVAIELDIKRCLERGTDIPMRNIRGIWYYAIKSLLKRIYSGKQEELNKFYYKESKRYEHKGSLDRRITQKISNKLVGIVFDEQRVTYDQLRIKDLTSWKRYSNQSVYGNVFIYVEKLTICDNIEHLSRLYDIPLFSGKGWTPKSLVEEIKDRLGTDRDYTVLCISDHDPTGDQIIKELENAGNKLGMRLQVVKIAIRQGDVSKEVFEANKFEVPFEKPNRRIYNEWVAEHGTYGLELEALTANMFDKFLNLIVTKFEEYCPEQEMFDYLRKDSLSDVPESVAEEIVSKIKRQIADKIEEIVREDINFDDRPDLTEGTLTNAAKNQETYIMMDNEELVERGIERICKSIKNVRFDPETHEVVIVWKDN